ncbi:MAG: bifunctional transaldolase/phosoglucose isomerase [Pyrinomonadaceae bacterium]|nr:bifunctional transaldolase/phosoglucose isomerase [Pyrinomonadaceae bacterium]
MSSTPRPGESYGSYQALIENTLKRIEREDVIRRIWERDATLWKEDEAHRKIISNSLGWLTVARLMLERVDEIEAFAVEVREAGFQHVMLLGMGGSSLCPEVMRRTFGQQENFPQLLVLDTTDPDTISALETIVDLERTLFVVASKSGTTIEPLSFYKYFYDRVRSLKNERAGENFVAITDPGTLMEQMATEAGFRRIFLNPSDIGGRYSALSYFGMVPAGLMGLDVRELLKKAVAMMDACAHAVPIAENPGAQLGAMMGALALEGRDKLTLVLDESLASLGLWIEQLVAESTGKEGKGIVPVAGEPLAAPDVYGDDRVFVYVHLGEPDAETGDNLRALEAAGHPLLQRPLSGTLDLCAEFFVWEFATAIAGALMAINPFDQPNVQESKDNTNKLLDEFKKTGALPEQQTIATEGDMKVYGASQERIDSAQPLAAVIKEHLSRAGSGDYIALLAYIEETEAHNELLQALRTRLRDKLKVATTTGYGPRFLHSTGQLHKGGADNGIFIQLTSQDHTDLAIPGEPYTFSILKEAQALGDFSSLEQRDRRAIRVHLGSDEEAGLKRLLQIVSDEMK